MPKLEITSQERSALRAAAHSLRPVVMIGDKGLTEAVLKEIDSNLTAHGLIKVRIAGHERDQREAMLSDICEQVSCAPVHHLGKILILHRPGPDRKAAPVEDGLQTRAVRKPSEPYTPKKQAAHGVSRSRRDAQQARSARRKSADDQPAPRRASATRAGTASRDAHGIPRRSGSALSLRAGARRSGPRRGDR